MVCKHCGSQNAEGVRFCTNCGADLSAEQTTTYTPYPQGNPYGYNQPQNTQPASQPAPQPGKGLAIAGMVCGIISLLCLPIVLGPLGIIFGGVAKSKGCRSGMATAGIVCGAIGLALWLLMMVAGFSILPDLSSSIYRYY